MPSWKGISTGPSWWVRSTTAVASPTLAVLALPLATSPTAASAVAVLSLGAIGAATTLARAGLRGDGVLLTGAALAATTVEVVDGAATEYRGVDLVTDPDGRWRLGGVRGVPELRITTAAGGFLTDGPRTHPLAPFDPYVINTALTT